MIGSAPKRIFPSQTGQNSFKSSQIMTKKLFREESSTDAHPAYQSDAQWESTLDNLGPRMAAEKTGQSSNQHPDSNITGQKRKMQNIQTTNFGVVEHQNTTKSYNLSPMAALQNSNLGAFQFDL